MSPILHNRYQLQSLLERTKGRRTLLAIDLQTQTQVVIKLLLFGPDFSWSNLKLFERGVETLKSLDHKSLPRYLDFFEMDTKVGKGFALVQTYIRARSLQDWVQSGRRFSEAELKVIAKDLLEILDYLHSVQPPVIHRDIKPSNILLGDRNGNNPSQVYLIDFGSVQAASCDGTMTVVGTYGYMPPEQFGGRAIPASDLYSLGATLIYLATEKNLTELPHDDLRIEFEPFVSLSSSFVQWLRWLTETALSKRPISAKQALQQLTETSIREDQSHVTRNKDNIQFASVKRPFNSVIQLQKTPTTIEITVPSSRVGLSSNSSLEIDPSDILALKLICILGLFLISKLVLIDGLWFFMLIIFPLFLVLLTSFFSSPEFYSIKLFLNKGEAFLSIDKVHNKKIVRTYSKQMISSVHTRISYAFHHNLVFVCRNSRISIGGTDPEIQWLYSELSRLI